MKTTIEWRDVEEDPPEDGQQIIVPYRGQIRHAEADVSAFGVSARMPKHHEEWDLEGEINYWAPNERTEELEKLCYWYNIGDSDGD